MLRLKYTWTNTVNKLVFHGLYSIPDSTPFSPSAWTFCLKQRCFLVVFFLFLIFLCSSHRLALMNSQLNERRASLFRPNSGQPAGPRQGEWTTHCSDCSAGSTFFCFVSLDFFFFKLLPKLDLRRVQDVDLFTTVLICSRFPSYCSKMTVWSQQVIHTRPLLSAGGNLPHHQWSRAPDALPPPLLGEELTRLVSSLGRSRPLLISTASGHRPSTTSSFFILLFHFSYFFFSSSQFTVNCQLFVSRYFFSYSWTTYKFSVELFLCSLKNLETFHINFASSINS